MAELLWQKEGLVEAEKKDNATVDAFRKELKEAHKALEKAKGKMLELEGL